MNNFLYILLDLLRVDLDLDFDGRYLLAFTSVIVVKVSNDVLLDTGKDEDDEMVRVFVIVFGIMVKVRNVSREGTINARQLKPPPKIMRKATVALIMNVV
jgi:hypothetical protein